MRDREKGREIEKICSLLIEYDIDILEIVRFGSSVYAPEHARDVDFLVITSAKKDCDGYLDCLAEIDFDVDVDVDVVVKEVGENLNKRFARNVLGAFEILHSDGIYFKEMVKEFEHGYEEAKSHLRRAKAYLSLAEESENEYDKDGHIRTAFNELFHGARVASMAFLATENAR